MYREGDVFRFIENRAEAGNVRKLARHFNGSLVFVVRSAEEDGDQLPVKVALVCDPEGELFWPWECNLIPVDFDKLTEKEIEELMATKTHINEDVLKQILARQEQRPSASSSPAEPEPERKPVVIPEGYKAYTDVFGDTLTGMDHAVKVFVDEDWPEHLRPFIPDADQHYVFPKGETEQFVVALMQGDKIFVHGPKGSGKSSLTEQVCARLRIPFIRVNCREDMESSAIFGSVDVQNGNMVWHPGPAEELGLGGGVLQIDEISATPSGINMAMQWMLEENGKIFLADKPGSSDDKLIRPNEWFRVVATDNTQLQGDTSGHYAGTQVQNEAMLDRFQTTIKLGYLDKKHETTIIMGKCPGISAGWVRDMVEFARLVRSGYEKGSVQFTMSPRTLINWGRKAVYWHDPVMALKIAFFDKLVDDDRPIVNEFCMKVFGKELV